MGAWIQQSMTSVVHIGREAMVLTMTRKYVVMNQIAMIAPHSNSVVMSLIVIM